MLLVWGDIKMKLDFIPSEEFAKRVANDALDTFVYEDLTLREWANKITSGEYQPVKRGKWSEKPRTYKDKFGNFCFGFQCSECGVIINKTRYWGNCGAKMDGEK